MVLWNKIINIIMFVCLEYEKGFYIFSVLDKN